MIKHLLFLLLLSLLLYIYTLHGRSVSNHVYTIDPDFKPKVEKLCKNIEHLFQTDSHYNENMLIEYIQSLKDYDFIHNITVISHDYNICFTQKQNTFSYSNNINMKDITPWYKNNIVFSEWSNPVYLEHSVDRGFLLNYTSNVINVINGHVDAVINISCKSKLRRRNELVLN